MYDLWMQASFDQPTSQAIRRSRITGYLMDALEKYVLIN